MKRLLISIAILITLFASTSKAEYFKDVIITSPTGIWTDERAYNTLSEAISAIGSAEQTLLISRQVACDSLTIPANIKLHFVKDGSINNSGTLILETKDITAGDHQIFTGTGDVDFVPGSIVKSGWFSDIVEAIDQTNDDELTLLITQAEFVTANCTIGNNVHLKWDSPRNRLTANAGVTVDNIGQISAGNYQLFAGAGIFAYRDGVSLNLSWFASLRSAIRWIDTAEATLVIPGINTVDFDETVPANVTLDFTSQRGQLSVGTGITLTIYSPANIKAASRQQIKSGAGVVSFTAAGEVFTGWFGDDLVAATTAAAANSTVVLSDDVAVDGGDFSCSKSITIKGTHTIQLNSSLSTVVMLAFGGATSDIVIEGPTLDINQPTTDAWTNVVIQADGVRKIILKSPTKITNSAASAFPAANNGYGLYLLGAYGMSVVEPGVVFEKIRYAYITHASSTGKAVKSIGAIYRDLAGDGIEINVSSGTCEDVYVAGNTFENMGSNNTGRGFGFGASGAIDRIRITGNDFNGADNQSIHIEGSVNTTIIDGNTHNNFATAASVVVGAAVSISPGVGTVCSLVSISNEIIIGAATSDYGIYIGGAGTINSAKVINCIVSGVGNGNGILTSCTVLNLDVIGNTIINSKGSAIRYASLNGSIINNTAYDDQGTKTQTYGLELTSNPITVDIRGNNFSGNENIGILLTSLSFPKSLTGYKERITGVSALATAYTAWTNILYLGQGGSGSLYGNAVLGTSRSTAVHDFTWDGTTLELTQRDIESSGVLALSGTPSSVYQMSGNWLQMRVYNDGAATDLIALTCEVAGLLSLK